MLPLVPWLGLILVVTGCADSSPPTTTVAASSTITSSTPTSPDGTSTSFPPTSSTVATTTTVLPTQAEIEAAWQGFWQAWADVRASEPLDQGPLDAVATPEVVADTVALFERDRETGRGAVATDVKAGATVVELGPEQATVEDCVLLTPSFTNTPGVLYNAELELRETGWIVTQLRIPSGRGCVPIEVAQAAIAGYDGYYEAEQEFWDPPNAQHPQVAEVLAEPQLSFIRGLLDEHERRGVALRGVPTTHPEVIEVRSAAEVVVLSCNEPDPDYGVYDLATGQRLTDEPPVRPGQRNLQSAVMVLEDDRWKVSDFQGQVDFACEFAPTDRGLPAV